jgi:hypothetical protein
MHSAPRRLRLSSARALVIDILHFDRQIPSFAHDREFRLATLAELRAGAPARIAWPVLFIKAYGMLSAECAAFRRTWFRWPWPHLYEHPYSIGMLALSREHQGEERLFWVRFRRPELHSLVELQQSLERHQVDPIEQLFRRQLIVSRLPTPLRRAAWQLTFHLSGRKRASRLGTFALTTLASEGATIQRPPSIHTSTLTYGPLDEAGRMRVTIVYDHRLMDGRLVARSLARLEQHLLGPIADELRGMRNQTAWRKAS